MTSVAEKQTILVTGADLAPQAVAMLKDFEIVYAGKAPDTAALVALCAEHQPVGIIVRYGKIPAEVMDASRRLRVISKHGTGVDTIDGKAAAERGIAVKAAVGANAPAVAEHTWALIMACAKSVVQLNARMHDGHWDKATHKSIELKGRTLGLVGFGAIGQRVADVAVTLGMNVLAYDPFARKEYPNVTLCDLDTLYAQSDVVSLHCPLTEDNKQMINRDSIAKMRAGAILVNTARGGLVDEAAVIEAVKSGRLHSAGLDSFASEPLIGSHHFSDVDNIVLSPHIGGVTGDAYIGMGTGAAANILAVLAEVPAGA
ncbi:D-3-phosphoglycerate dehydrogenase [Noviherbaspirillum humi]|uniref:D-3-phosphoglycerate dehydrogenase n=1 Tax=Noviherbaspirillum humi TaxID=1688639 RepID=A0A239IG28_9BURK|nr:hydroxyacid dehydrogenase [Noviherbaspirillum humi]SNS92489.1 D-3-phosphoglycerate dehydrogenase [Noviherbaspirillum humi]